MRRQLVSALVLVAMLSAIGYAKRSFVPAEAKDAAAIRQTLVDMNTVCAARDVKAFSALFDEGDDVMFVGSDKGEIFHGQGGVLKFTKMLFGASFVFSFDLQDVSISQTGDYAWVFVDGNMVRTVDRGESAGKVLKKPYRFSIAMVKKSGHWKWQLFHGAVPGAE